MESGVVVQVQIHVVVEVEDAAADVEPAFRALIGFGREAALEVCIILMVPEKVS